MSDEEIYKPQLFEPRRSLLKAMARRAKTSHLGSFQILPEHVVLSCFAQLPRLDHDAVADCSTGFRALMRSERFLKARRAEDITEETLVLVGDCFMALVSQRMWRRLAPMPAEMKVELDCGVARASTAAIGSELFVCSGTRQAPHKPGVAVYDAIDDEWFNLPRPSICPQHVFAVACAGRLFVGGRWNRAGHVCLRVWDAESQKWADLPPMPPPLPQTFDGYTPFQLVAVAAGSEIFVLDRYDPASFRVFDVGTESWRTVAIPSFVTIQNPRDTTAQQRENMKIPEPWPGLQADRRLIHVFDPPPVGDHSRRDHYAYDTTTGQWVGFSGYFCRHSVYGDSDRVMQIENYDGPDDYVLKFPKVGRWNRGNWEPAQSSGCVMGYTRKGDHGTEGYCIRWTEFTGLPVRYDAIEAAFYVHMP